MNSPGSNSSPGEELPQGVDRRAPGVFGRPIPDLGERRLRDPGGGVHLAQLCLRHGPDPLNNFRRSFHTHMLPYMECSCLPLSVYDGRYRTRMSRHNLKQLLWESVAELMKWRYGRENLTKLADDCGIGPGTASRIKERQTEVRLETIEAIAKKFGFEAWQLLVPGFDPKNPPQLAGSDLPEDQQELLQTYRELDVDTRPALINRAKSLREAVVSSRTPRKSRAA